MKDKGPYSTLQYNVILIYTKAISLSAEIKNTTQIKPHFNQGEPLFKITLKALYFKSLLFISEVF